MAPTRDQKPKSPIRAAQVGFLQLGQSPTAEVTLQRAHLEIVPKVGLDALRRGDGSGKSGVVWDFMQEGSTAQGTAIGQGRSSFRGVENELNTAVFNGIDDMRPA